VPHTPKLAHVAERHRRAGRLLGLHLVSFTLEAQFELWASRVKTRDPTIAQSIGGAFLKTRFAKRYRLTNIYSSANVQRFPAKGVLGSLGRSLQIVALDVAPGRFLKPFY
jgi:hypothetical protein